MHPRNIYNKPPNFADLKDEFPEFAAKVHIDLHGKIKLDFKDPNAVRILSKCCLKKDFNLNVELPPDKLLPTLPLRINYILWIEDILNHYEIKDNVIGIDIGTGASCIYCLLSLRMNSNWRMYALEIDKDNIYYAKANIKANNLNDKITVIDQEKSDKIFENLFSHDSDSKTFTICNPPFFSSNYELKIGENRTGNRKRPHSSYSLNASSETIFKEGGELGFVTKILEESLILRDKIEIYSSMFGCKKNFQKFLSVLKKHNIGHFTTTELVQGKTFRWAVAWSFNRALASFRNDTKIQDSKLDKKTNVLKHTLVGIELNVAHDKLLNIFSKLEITTKLIKSSKDKFFNYQLEAFKNTWSNQRRKRRAETRNMAISESSDHTEQQNLLMNFEINELNASIILKIFYIGGSMSKDCVHQIFQYIKNNLK